MINHVSIGVRDIERAKRFYDAVLTPLGYKCIDDGAASLGYGHKATSFWVLAVEKPVPASAASGLHFCFDAPSQDSVRAFYEAALANGGSDNGPPGIRGDYGTNYFAAFATDPDGYRIEAFCGK
jgi:catechol 2,3-dioxygenase-like lactoylglutathione lyase family enzyme